MDQQDMDQQDMDQQDMDQQDMDQQDMDQQDMDQQDMDQQDMDQQDMDQQDMDQQDMDQQDMDQQDMDQQDMNQLTNAIDSCTYKTKNNITPRELHIKLWPCLDRLRNDPNKNNLIESWKYKTELINTEASHANGLQTCETVSWAQSFVLNLWLSIHH